MNNIRQIKELNKRELENGVSPEGSWHAEYRDTAYIYIGGLPFDLSEGDIITIFSQFGEPTFVNLIRDKETGKSRGFAFLKYEDQRSTDLAVDNLGGTTIMGRMIQVDHTRYKNKDDENEQIQGENNFKAIEDAEGKDRGDGTDNGEERPMLKEERELARLIADHDEDDPMKAFLVQEKKEEVAAAIAALKDGKRSRSEHKRRHHHHRSHRSSEKDAQGERKESSHREHGRHKHHRSRSRDRISSNDHSRDYDQDHRRNRPRYDD